MSSLFRVKCASCGKVNDIAIGGACPSCGKPTNITDDSYVQIYRMGSPVAMGAGFGIYINGQPCGHIGNTETVRIPLAYGTYTFHFTCGMTRKCDDITVTISPAEPKAYIKCRIRMGFWSNKISTERSTKENMAPI